MGHYGRHLTKSYTVALKCTFLIIPLLLFWQTHSARFSLIKSLSFALPSLWLTLTSVEPSWYQEGFTESNLCHRRLVLLTSCKSSDLDPIPTSLVKDCIDILITPITSIIKLSLTEGSFPSHFKSAQVSPTLKKPSLDMDSMNNYWSVSNFSFLSKVLEKVGVNQLNSHINSSNTSTQYQSAYRKFHSTETALLKIHNDILASMDAGKVTALTLLDLSAAVDTIDHTFLLRRLDDWFWGYREGTRLV